MTKIEKNTEDLNIFVNFIFQVFPIVSPTMIFKEMCVKYIYI